MGHAEGSMPAEEYGEEEKEGPCYYKILGYLQCGNVCMDSLP